MNGPVGIEGFVCGHVAGLRERAALLASYGASEASQALLRATEDLEAAFRGWWLADLTAAEAAAEAGYSTERMRELIRADRVDGSKGKAGPLRILRCDLPRKPGRPAEGLAHVASRLGIE